MESYTIVRIPGDPRTRHGWASGGSKSHSTIDFFVFFMCVLGAPDTDYPFDADFVGGAYFPRRKARREVPPPPSNKKSPNMRDHHHYFVQNSELV